jgi:UDP-glucose 4-epimerase
MANRDDAVLVTGGAGFIGSELVRQLVAAGHSVIVLDNLATGRRAHLEALPPDRVRLVVGDVRDRAVVARLLAEDVSIVFHLACVNLRHALTAPRDAHDVNATATLDLVIAAREAGVPRFVHVSSSEVYGSAQAARIAEDHPTMPTTAYGASKLAGEAYVRAIGETSGYPVVVVRPFNSFGPRSHHNGTSGEVIPRFLVRAMAARPLVVFGDGRQSRDFTHVIDTTRGILLAGTTDAAVGRTINIGSGREIGVLDIARAIAALTGDAVTIEHAPPRPGDIARQCADTALARGLLGFEPRVSFEAGLCDLLGWFSSQYAGRVAVAAGARSGGLKPAGYEQRGS